MSFVDKAESDVEKALGRGAASRKPPRWDASRAGFARFSRCM